MKKILIIIIYLLINIIAGSVLFGEDFHGDNVPPEQGTDSRWFSVYLPFNLSFDRENQISIHQTDSIVTLVENDIEQNETAPVSSYRYRPQIIIYSGDNEYQLDLERLKGLTPGYPMNSPQGLEVNYNGKYLNRDQWSYSLHFQSEQFFNVNNVNGIIYSVIEIELGNGKGYLPIIVLFTQSTPSVTSGRER